MTDRAPIVLIDDVELESMEDPNPTPRIRPLTDAETSVMEYATRTGRFPCHRCGEEITGSQDTFLVLNPYRDNVPREPFLAHGRCFNTREHYYSIELWRIRLWGDDQSPYQIRDSYRNWQAHLWEKDWWRENSWGVWLILAHTCAKTLPGGQDEIDKRIKQNAIARYVPPSIRARVLERNKFTCQRCGAKAPDVRLHVDHVTPVARGGRPSIDNLQTLCETCNNGKGDREPTEHDLRRPTA